MNGVIMVQLVDLVLWVTQLMPKRVIEVLMVRNIFYIPFRKAIFLFLLCYSGLPGPSGSPGPAGVPGDKGALGDKGLAGDETYGKFDFFSLSVLLLLKEVFSNRTTWK